MLAAFVVIEIYDWKFYEFVSLTMTFQFLLLLLRKMGTTIPIKEFTAFIYCVQLLIGPIWTYRFYPNIKIGFMIVNEDVYFPFTLTYILAFFLGLFFPRFSNSNVILSQLVTRSINKKESEVIGIILIVIAFVAQTASSLFPSPGLSFIYVLLGSLRFVGLYYLWIAKYKYRYLFLLAVFLPMSVLSLGGGLFIELFIWGFLTFAVFQLRHPLSFRTNILAFLGGVLFVFLLQTVKVDFRKVTWKGEGKDYSMVDRLAFLGTLITSVNFSDKQAREKANIRFIVRINQGYINAYILRNMPARRDFANGEYFKDELIGIFVPRFLFPDKAVVGDHAKFENFAGWKLNSKVAMSVSILGDGYGNFGYWGGMVFCLLYGVLTNYLLHLLVSLARKHEITLILWMPYVFAFTMRCGDEFYIITNHIFKSSILILVIMVILKKSGYFTKKVNVK